MILFYAVDENLAYDVKHKYVFYGLKGLIMAQLSKIIEIKSAVMAHFPKKKKKNALELDLNRDELLLNEAAGGDAQSDSVVNSSAVSGATDLIHIGAEDSEKISGAGLETAKSAGGIGWKLPTLLAVLAGGAAAAGGGGGGGGSSASTEPSVGGGVTTPPILTTSDKESPQFLSERSAENVVENSSINQVIYVAKASDNVGVVRYELSGKDADKLSIDSQTGRVTLVKHLDYELQSQVSFVVVAYDAAGNSAEQEVVFNIENVDLPEDLFSVWQTADKNLNAGDVNALQQHSPELSSIHEVTSVDGLSNGTNALNQYINRVTGSDVVSQEELNAGFSISGRTQTGAESTIQFYLDNDRTDGINEIGIALIDGEQGVHIDYDALTGDFTVSFDAQSSALKSASHNTYGSGVHQLVVDTDGDGVQSDVEASRLFLVASGTAEDTDTGTVAQNYSVMDTVTDDVFVYYYGDPDGSGIGLFTSLDRGDAEKIDSIYNSYDADGDGYEFDYYNQAGYALGAQTTAANTALHFVTEIPAQTWEFHIADLNYIGVWNESNQKAGDHELTGSNTSRMPALDELIAVYTANFGLDYDKYEDHKIVGALQYLDNTNSMDGADFYQDNFPFDWTLDGWAYAPTPSGHANLSFIGLGAGDVYEDPHVTYATYAVL